MIGKGKIVLGQRWRPLSALILALTFLLVPALTVHADTLASATTGVRAVRWLLTQQKDDGGFPGLKGQSDPSTTSDVVLALASFGIDPASVTRNQKSPLDFLAAQATNYANTVGGAAKLALAVIASGQSPRSFGGLDLIRQITQAYDPKTGLYSSQLFADAYALLALAAAKVEIPQQAVQGLIAHQGADGSWAWDGSTDAGAGDSNTTAIVLQALRAAGVAANDPVIVKGLGYLHTVQQPDGSFGYQPGQDGDANSTALAIQAILAAGQHPESNDWHNASAALLRFANADGAFRWRNDSPDDNLLATVQALPALAAVPFPFMLQSASVVARQDEIQDSLDCDFFAETHHNLCGAFRTTWQQAGGLPNLGYPLTRPYYDAQRGAVVQWFERARLEWHPDMQGQPMILLGRLGAEWAATHAHGPAFQQTPQSTSPACRYFPETHHNVCNGFRAYWEQFGGLAVFGYPLSEEYTENGVVVQVFERARFEWHPGAWPTRYDVLLTRLGAEQLGVS